MTTMRKYSRKKSKLRKKVRTRDRKKNRKQRRTKKRRGGSIWSSLFSPTTDVNSSSTVSVVDTIKYKALDAATISTGIAVAAVVGKIAVTALVGVGLSSPAMPAVAVLLLIAYELAEMFKNNLILSELMAETMTILSNIYKLNKLIDKRFQIYYIYIFNNIGFETLYAELDNAITAAATAPAPTLTTATTTTTATAATTTTTATDAAQTLNVQINKLVTNSYANTKNTVAAAAAAAEVTANNDGNALITKLLSASGVFVNNNSSSKNENAKNEGNYMFLGKLVKDKEIDDGLYKKVTTLTKLLLELMPTTGLQAFKKKTSQNSGTQFSSLLNKEIKQREGKSLRERASRVANFANRKYNTYVGATTTIAKIVQYLAVINGFFALLLGQYNTHIEYYSNTLDPDEYKKIWHVLIRQEEYISYISPTKGIEDSIKIFAREKNNLKFLPAEYSDPEEEKEKDSDQKNE
jgi:hypothetical protein